MKKEWFTAQELAGANGLPITPQGIHCMARRQKWEKRRRVGVQGKAVEYHASSLPKVMKPALVIQEKSAEYLCATLCANGQDPLLIWIESYKQLNSHEREHIVSFIMREGMLAVINRLGNERGHGGLRERVDANEARPAEKSEPCS